MATQTSSREVPETQTRVTKEGRKLTYQLTVIQQPERARACGSGAKCERFEIVKHRGSELC
jgi:hypothetical protein